MTKNNTEQLFFKLLRAGLWERDDRLLSFEKEELLCVCQLAKEQSVTGLIAAGLEHTENTEIPKEVSYILVRRALQIEKKNNAMNSFIAKVIDKMRAEGIFALLIKGQGVAQCYERPLWRACGDVDLLLDDVNFEKAKSLLLPLSKKAEEESNYAKHLGMTIDSWVVELHGTIRRGLSKRIDRVLDSLQKESCCEGAIRTWHDEKVDVFLPNVDNEVLFIFTHFLNHFYKGGIGLRQICDWCRLLWVFSNEIKVDLLDERLRRMRLTTEWKAFASFAVEYLGMPAEAMPFYSSDIRWKRKADRICSFIMEVGDFGHNRDTSYYKKYPRLVRKVVSFGRRCGDTWRHARIFPIDTFRFLPSIVRVGIINAV